MPAAGIGRWRARGAPAGPGSARPLFACPATAAGPLLSAGATPARLMGPRRASLETRGLRSDRDRPAEDHAALQPRHRLPCLAGGWLALGAVRPAAAFPGKAGQGELDPRGGLQPVWLRENLSGVWHGAACLSVGTQVWLPMPLPCLQPLPAEKQRFWEAQKHT